MAPIGIFWFWIIAVALRSANCDTKISPNEKDVKLPELSSELDLDSVEASEEDIDKLSKIVKRLAPEKNDKGQPGVDYPMLTTIPPTKFNCKEHKDGYYGDAETNCQVFHICDNGRKISFLCPNGTIFQQSQLICDWWFKVDCSKSAELYEQSAEQLAKEERKRADKKRMNSEFHRLNNDNTENNNYQQYPQQNSGGKQTAGRENNFNYGQASKNQLPGTEQRTNEYKNSKTYEQNQGYNQQNNNKKQNNNNNNQQVNNYSGINSLGPTTENTINNNNNNNKLDTNIRGRNYPRNQLVDDDDKNDKYNNEQRGVNKYSSQVSQSNQDHAADNYYTTTTIRENLRQSKSRKNQYLDNDDSTNRGATPAYIETTTFRTSTPSPIIKEFQQPAESAAFVSQRNRYNKMYPDQFNSFYNNNNNRETVSPAPRKNSLNPNSPQNILRPREQIPDFPHSTFNPIYKPRTTTTTEYPATEQFGQYQNTDYTGQSKNERLIKNSEQRNTTPYITTQDFRARNQDFRTSTQSVNTDSARTYQDTSSPGTSYTERAETTTNTHHAQTFSNKKIPNNTGRINYESSRTTTTTIRPFFDEQKVGQTAGNPTQPIVKYQDNINNNNKFNNYDQNSLGTTQSQDLRDGTINQVRAPLKSTIKISQNINQNNVISSTEKPLKNQQNFNNNNRGSKAYDGSITYQNGKTQQQSSTVLPYIPFTKNYAYVTAPSQTTSQKPPAYTATVPTFTGTFQKQSNPAKQNINNNTVSKFKGSASAYLPNVRSNQNGYLPKKAESLTEKQHALNMLKSLKGLEGTMPTIAANSRDGLTIPHSSSPATLHSLALYFAQNSAEQSSNEAADLQAPPLPNRNEKIIKNDANKTVDLPTSILTQHTINSYVELFNLNNALDAVKNSTMSVDANSSNDGEEEDDDDASRDDLDRQQSEGPVSGVKKSNSTKLRELAQVFTHALSAYLQDPDTFKKILTEIRPTEPAPVNDIDSNDELITTTTMLPTTTEIYPTTSEDYPSVTKEKDEVLDFSEDIIGPRRRPHHHHQTTTEIPTTTTTDDAAFGVYTTSLTYSDSNFPLTTTPAPLDSTRDYLNPPSDDFASAVNREFSNNNELQGFTGPSGPTSNESDNYFPADYNEDNRSGKFLKNSTSYQPYGQFVKPGDSKPIGGDYESASTPESYEETFPPNHQREELTTTTTEPFRIRYYDTTTIQSNQQNDVESLVTANSVYSGSKVYNNQASTLKGGSLDRPSYNAITQPPSQSTNPVTKKTNDRLANKDIENKINNHWTSEPVTQLWESNVFVDPHHINHGLVDATTSIENYTERDNPTTTTDSSVTSSEELLVTDATNSIKPRNSKQYSNNNSNNNNNDIDSINNGPSTPWEWAGTENEEPTAFTLLPTVHLNDHTATPAPQFYHTPKSTTTTTTITSSITTKNNKPNEEIYSITKTTNKKYNNSNSTDNEMIQAKEMFGNLNDTSSATLMKVMKTADNDVTVRQLVLLLISHCSGPMNKTKESERDELLNELLKMPVNEFSDESREIVSGINRVSLSPIVVADREVIRRASYLPTSTEPIVTTYRSKKLKRVTANAAVDDDDGEVGDVVAETVVSDGRALELLRSLYTIAAKWG